VARLKGSEQKLRTVRATSAGGIVLRPGTYGPEIVLGRRRRERDGVTWSLPKGTPHAGESIEETAVREVVEETGLDARIVAPAGAIEYWFVADGARIHKTVHYWLMEATDDDVAGHDHEFDEVAWFTLAEAERRMSFETERDLLSRSSDAIERLVADRDR
jgi:8-oxo-dGTP pyrophosphatase MutT (NUDIX family)